METNQKTIDSSRIFNGTFLKCNEFYMYCFNTVPSVVWSDKIDTVKALSYIKQEYGSVITAFFQHSRFKAQKKDTHFYSVIILFRDRCLVNLEDNYCEILFAYEDHEMANRLIAEIAQFKQKEKRKKFEINLIAKDNHSLELKAMGINKTKLDLSLYYEDDFVEVNNTILQRLNKRNDKGIVLLHGLPGTGKTTYLRYLIGKIRKKVLFLSSAMAENIMSSEFMDLLIDHPNSVVVIEDAENVLTDRKINSYSSVSNILNISDGMLADFLNIQVICTFNQSLSVIDDALMRKGRLIARYAFGKLSIPKAQRLSDHMGFSTVIQKPMTVAEIVHQHEKQDERTRTEIIGFRRTLTPN